MSLSPGVEGVVALAPIAGLAGNVIGHWLSSQFLRGSSLILRLLTALFGGLLCLAITVVAMTSEQAPMPEIAGRLLINAAASAALAYGYLNFIQLSVSSLRVRMALELLDHGQGLTMEQMLAKYDSRQIVQVRLQRLKDGRFIIERNGRWHAPRSLIWWLGHGLSGLKSLLLSRRPSDPDADLR